MRKIRVLVCLFFVVSCVCYGLHTAKVKMTEDQNPPVISFEEEVVYISKEMLDASEGTTDEMLLTGVTAMDEEDGDLTERIQIASMSRLMAGGKRTVQYIVFDDANQLGTAERTIVYTDYTPPRIYLKEPLRFFAEDYEEEMNSLELTASDCIDGNLTENIRTTFGKEMVDLKAGSYPITFQVNNSAGDSCVVPMEIVIVDSASESGKYYPLLKEYIAYTAVGTELNPSSYLKGIASESETYIFGKSETPANISASKVSIQSNVDYNTPGVYTVNYSYTTRDKVKATTVLYVVVEG